MSTAARISVTCRRRNAGNLAIESDTFEVPTDLARLMLKLPTSVHGLEFGVGQYWERWFAKPVRRAVRAKEPVVMIRSGGFASGDLSNALALLGAEVECVYE